MSAGRLVASAICGKSTRHTATASAVPPVTVVCCNGYGGRQCSSFRENFYVTRAARWRIAAHGRGLSASKFLVAGQGDITDNHIVIHTVADLFGNYVPGARKAGTVRVLTRETTSLTLYYTPRIPFDTFTIADPNF